MCIRDRGKALKEKFSGGSPKPSQELIQRLMKVDRVGMMYSTLEKEGREPALTFGNLADSGSEVNQILSSQRTITRRVALGTGPNVFYIV